MYASDLELIAQRLEADCLVVDRLNPADCPPDELEKARIQIYRLALKLDIKAKDCHHERSLESDID